MLAVCGLPTVHWPRPGVGADGEEKRSVRGDAVLVPEELVVSLQVMLIYTQLLKEKCVLEWHCLKFKAVFDQVPGLGSDYKCLQPLRRSTLWNIPRQRDKACRAGLCPYSCQSISAF